MGAVITMNGFKSFKGRVKVAWGKVKVSVQNGELKRIVKKSIEDLRDEVVDRGGDVKEIFKGISEKLKNGKVKVSMLRAIKSFKAKLSVALSKYTLPSLSRSDDDDDDDDDDDVDLDKLREKINTGSWKDKFKRSDYSV